MPAALRILENCSTARRGFKRGEVVAVGEDISAEDAAVLLRLRRAETCEVVLAADKPDAEKPATKPRTSRPKV